MAPKKGHSELPKPSRAHSALLHSNRHPSLPRSDGSTAGQSAPAQVLRVSLTQAFIDWTCSFSTWAPRERNPDGPPEGAGSQPRAISGAKSGPVIGLVVVQVAWEEDIGSRVNGNIPRRLILWLPCVREEWPKMEANSAKPPGRKATQSG